jgi:hypothetical protein
MKIELECTDFADLKAKVLAGAAVFGAAAGGGQQDGGGSGQTGDSSPDPKDWSDAKIQAKFFTADQVVALYPSPEGSAISVDAAGVMHPVDGSIKFLKSYQGAVWKFDTDANGKPIPLTSEFGTGWQVSCNDQKFGLPVNQLTVAQGQIYMMEAGGFLQRVKVPDNVIAGVYNANLPTLWVPSVWGYENIRGLNGAQTGGGSGGGTNTGTGGVPMPNDPPIPTVQPGSSGRVILVGDTAAFQYQTFAAALGASQVGDTVKWAGKPGFVSAESFVVPEGREALGGGGFNVPMSQVKQAILDGVAAKLSAKDLIAKVAPMYTDGVILDGDSQPALAHGGLGMVVPEGNAKVSGFHIRNVGMHEATHGGTGAIRHWDGAVGQMQGHDNFIHDCQNGIGPGGDPNDQGNVYQLLAGPWDNTVIIQCGLPDGSGGSHNVYDLCVRSIFGTSFYSVIRPFAAGDGGHAYKSRGYGRTFLSNDVMLIGSDSSAYDIPDGGAVQDEIPAGVIIMQSEVDLPDRQFNHTLIGYCTESSNNGSAGIVCKNTFAGPVASPNIYVGAGKVDITGAVIQTAPIHGEGGGTLTGGAAA